MSIPRSRFLGRLISTPGLIRERVVSDEKEQSTESEPPASEIPPRPSDIPPDGDDDPRRRRLEKLLRETIRRGLEKGVGTFAKTDSALRDLVGDVKLPREVVGYVFSQVDETKNALVRVVAREVREFLEATDVAHELQKALTSLSFEIKTEIRFIPNDAGTGVKPDVKAKVVPKRKGSKDGDEADDGEDSAEMDDDA